MSRSRTAVLHAGLVRRTTAGPVLQAMQEPPAIVRPVPAEPPRPLAAWPAPTVVPLRPVEPAPPLANPLARPKRKAMTVRLEPIRHQRLKAASAELQRSCQSILVEAMERWLDEQERGLRA
jgi:hypothetical protein